jgi:hypothetical protein
MELARIVVSTISILIFLPLCDICCILDGGADGKLSSDLLERVLGVWEAELATEERRLCRIPIRGR